MGLTNERFRTVTSCCIFIDYLYAVCDLAGVGTCIYMPKIMLYLSIIMLEGEVNLYLTVL